MSDTSTNNSPQKDILDNLLVKEEAGNLHYFQDKDLVDSKASLANISTDTSSDNASNKSDANHQTTLDKQANDMVLAPKDDNFSHDKDIQGAAKDKSELMFHPEDKMQIARLSESVPVDDSKKYSIEKIVEKILSKQNLQLDDNNKKLFTNLILDFFRNRRSVIATRELLATKIIFQEKTLAADIIDNILSIVKGLKNKIDLDGGLVVDAASIKEIPKIEAIKPVVASEDNVEVEPEEEGEPEANIFLNNLAEQKKDDDLDKIPEGLSQDEETPDLENNKENFVSPVKFGAELKGVNEDVSVGDLEVGQETKAELDQSLEEIKNINPDIVSIGASGDDTKQDEKTRQLLDDLVIDNDKKGVEDASDGSTIIPKEDLHDVGQLMTEDDDPDKDSEDDEFSIKKIKPAIVTDMESSENATETEANDTVKDEDKIAEEIASIGVANLTEERNKQPVIDEEVQQKPIEEKITQDTVAKNTASLPRVIRPGQTFDIKPKISDVQDVEPNSNNKKYVLTGPVEELRGMTLKNFRFLGTNAQDRTNKILEKITLLEQDSYTKKVAGIKAWRESQVNQLYLSIGSDSMAEGKEIATLIDSKKAAGEDTLTIQEFTAISDLNKSLRF